MQCPLAQRSDMGKKVLARARAWRYVMAATATAAGLGWMPGSSLFLGGVDAILIKKVAAAYGVTDFDIEAIIAMITKRFIGKSAAEILSAFVGPGWILKAGIASVITFMGGSALIAYMEAKSPYS